MTSGRQGLRAGLTTGTCAAAAAAAAARALAGEDCEVVEVTLPDGERVTLAVDRVERPRAGCARATVIKDAGDDPDVTHGMAIVAEVEVLVPASAGRPGRADAGDCALPVASSEMVFAAGPGVGTVTRAGLQVAPGEPAINPVPRRMIADAVRAVVPSGPVRVTVSIPGGEAAAARTFNRRLGIEGGLSVLGTSGRIMPKSADAWLRSLLPQVDVAVAEGHRTIYLAPGGIGERAARERLGAAEAAIAQCANFVGDLLDRCADLGVERVVLVGHAGKLLKVAAGVWDTHSRVADARLETLAALAAAAGASPTLTVELLGLPTVEAAIEPLRQEGMDGVWDDAAERAASRAAERASRRTAGGPAPRCDCAIVAYSGEILGRSTALREASSDSPGLALTVVGTGPGAAGWLTPIAWRAIRTAEVVAGGHRQLERFAPAGAARIVIGGDVEDVAAALRACVGRRVVVLASGDPGFFGILATLRRLLPAARIVAVPGISSAQVAAARLGRPWHDLRFASAHGVGVEGVVAAAKEHPSVLAVTDAARSPQVVATALVAEGLEATVTVFERLGEADERVTCADAATIADGVFDGLSVVLIERRGSA